MKGRFFSSALRAIAALGMQCAASVRQGISMAKPKALTPTQRVELAKALIIMADDLRFIGNRECDDYAVNLAMRLERKATRLLEGVLADQLCN